MHPTATPSRQNVIESIAAAVSSAMDVSRSALFQRDRGTGKEAFARHVVMAVLRQTTNFTFARIGRLFNREAGSVSSGIIAVAGKIAADQRFAELYAGLLEGRTVLRPLVTAPCIEASPDRITPAKVSSPSRQAKLCDKSTLGHTHELGLVAVRAKLKHAQDQRREWDGIRFRATREADRDAAAARVTLWDMQIAALSARLQQLTAA